MHWTLRLKPRLPLRESRRSHRPSQTHHAFTPTSQHIAPTCLLSDLGVVVPDDSLWWLAEDPILEWPQTSNPSPIVGWALDGFPIFGPYDDSGDLMIGTSHANTTLDFCNGKFVNGAWRYYITPNAPYTVGCFVGDQQGKVVEDTHHNAACPRRGINNTYVDADEKDVSLQTPDCAYTPYDGPLFLFAYPEPKLDGPCFQSQALFHGIIFLVLAVVSSAVWVALCSLTKSKVGVREFLDWSQSNIAPNTRFAGYDAATVPEHDHADVLVQGPLLPRRPILRERVSSCIRNRAAIWTAIPGAQHGHHASISHALRARGRNGGMRFGRDAITSLTFLPPSCRR